MTLICCWSKPLPCNSHRLLGFPLWERETGCARIKKNRSCVGVMKCVIRQNGMAEGRPYSETKNRQTDFYYKFLLSFLIHIFKNLPFCWFFACFDYTWSDPLQIWQVWSGWDDLFRWAFVIFVIHIAFEFLNVSHVVTVLCSTLCGEYTSPLRLTITDRYWTYPKWVL